MPSNMPETNYQDSSELFIISSVNNIRLTKAKSLEDYAVWLGNKIVAQGGRQLMTTIFNERIKKMSDSISQGVDISVYIGKYVKLRDAIKAQDDAHKEKMAPYREAKEKVEALLLDYLQQQKSESVKTENGTVYRTSRKSASLEDADAFMRHVIGSEEWDLLDRKANATAVEAYVKENGVLPPGVKYTVMHTVGVRRS